MTAHTVTTGERRSVWCPGCLTTSRVEADAYALMDSGVMRIGKFSHCPRCADTHRKGDA